MGAGTVGLTTAWFLQEAGVQVTVHEREHVAAGASWGTAGRLTPALTAPLPEPAVLHHGSRAVASPRSPVYVPLCAAGTVLRSSAPSWRTAPPGGGGGAWPPTCRSTSGRWRRPLPAELEQIRAAVRDVDLSP